MPRIPINNSQAQLTSKSPTTQVDVNLYGQEGRNQQVIGQGVDTLGKGFGELHQKVQEVADLNQKVYALKQHDQSMTDLEMEIANNPNITDKDEQDYLKRAQEARQQAVSTISNKKSQTLADLDFSQKENQLKIKLTGERYKQVGYRAKAELQDLEQRIIDKEGQGLDSSDLIRERQDLISKYDQLGIYNPEQAQERDAKFDKVRTKNLLDSMQAQAVASGDRKQVDDFIASLKDIEINGKKLSADMKADYAKSSLDALGNIQKRIESDAKDNVINNRVQSFVDLSQGKQVDIDQISETDPQLAAALNKVKEFTGSYDPKIPAEKQLRISSLMNARQRMQVKEYAKTITNTFNKNNNEDLSDFILKELDNKSDGLTSGVKLAAFANLAFLKSKANAPKTPEDSKLKNRFNAIKEAVNYLQASNAYLAPSAIGDFIVKNYHSGAATREETISEAKDVLREKIVDKHKAIAKLPSMPNKIVDGEQSVEDLQNGTNELDGEPYSGNYGDQSND